MTTSLRESGHFSPQIFYSIANYNNNDNNNLERYATKFHPTTRGGFKWRPKSCGVYREFAIKGQ